LIDAKGWRRRHWKFAKAWSLFVPVSFIREGLGKGIRDILLNKFLFAIKMSPHYRASV
jgi:hypothetical protein